MGRKHWFGGPGVALLSWIRHVAGMRPVAAVLLAWCVAQVPAQGFVPERLARVDALLKSEVAAGHHAGLSYVVWQGGREAAAGVFGQADREQHLPLRRDSIVRIYSMTKPITAIAALVTIEQQSLRLDAPVETWLPELQKLQVLTGGTAEAPQLEPMRTPITLRMLLSHTAGFSYDFYPNAPVAELYRRADLWQATSNEAFLQTLAGLPLVAQPGAAWHYSVADDVLGVWLERVHGKSLGAVLTELVTGPLGMRDTGFDVPVAERPRIATMYQWEKGALRPLDPTFGVFAEPGRGFEAGGAGLFSTLDDYLRFCRMLLGRGELDGVRLVGRKTFELASLDVLRDGQRTTRPGDGWGLFSAVRIDQGASPEFGSQGMLHGSGAASTHFFVDPVEDLCAVLVTQHQPFDQHRLIPRFHTAVYQALR